MSYGDYSLWLEIYGGITYDHVLKHPENVGQQSLCAQRSFPDDFLFGTASSAYQTAWNVSGKIESIWDYIIHNKPDLVQDGSNADVACDTYHHVTEDVQLIKNLGVDFYRFSLSWPRIKPSPFTNKVNPDGIRFYNELIDELLRNGIEPMITIFHWDLPQYLQKYGGFLNSEIIEAFITYATTVFENFGDRVKKWITFNEPREICRDGYGLLLANDSGVADYLCAYNLLKTHAHVYHLYNKTFKPVQKGTVSITLSSTWYEPASTSFKDVKAAERALEFNLGIYAHPIFTTLGDFPNVVKNRVAKRSKQEGYLKSRVATFTQAEINYVRGTSDFFYVNHYSSQMIKNVKPAPIGTPSTAKDESVYTFNDPSWPYPDSFRKVVPWGFKKLLVWIKEHYSDPEIYITENGFGYTAKLNDTERINYYYLYLNAVLEAMYTHGVRVKGYTAWSIMDNFEWLLGYLVRYGFYHVDFSNPMRPRTPRASANYYKEVIRTRVP